MQKIMAAAHSAATFGISKLHSRKFLVWAVASVGLFSHFVTNDQWVMISMMWLGAQTALDWKTNASQTSLPGDTKEE